MPRRLLFVDDEVLVLEGLRRTLHGPLREWEMHFVDNAGAALSALDEQVFDAVVTDMRMPVMDGTELLERVKSRHPSVIRIVLSGQSSSDAICRSLAPAHQFLLKPCDPQELVVRLNQAIAMRDLLSNQSIKTIVSSMRSIPSLPSLYKELTAALHSENISLGKVERIISKDVAMAAKILQLANSAFIGARGRVSSLLQAVSLVGTEAVRHLVLSVNVFSQLDKKSEIADYLPALWDHSVKVASLAQCIANCEGCSKALVEESLTAGLLHDIGKAILLAEMPRKYRHILEINPKALVSLELEHLGCTHAQVGAYLMSLWGLPTHLVHAVAFHHLPSQTADTQFSSLTAIHAADAIVSATDMSPLNQDIELDLNYLNRLGLQDRQAVWSAFSVEHSGASSKGGTYA
ncbi:MAG: response regulator [Terriglobales bacterium]